jgi:hypothetical protein
VAVLETARGGIVRRGLGYDWSDIGVMTNISDDHVGQDGIKSVDDINSRIELTPSPITCGSKRVWLQTHQVFRDYNDEFQFR